MAWAWARPGRTATCSWTQTGGGTTAEAPTVQIAASTRTRKEAHWPDTDDEGDGVVCQAFCIRSQKSDQPHEWSGLIIRLSKELSPPD